MDNSKFDGIEDLTEVKYDPEDPYKNKKKKIPCEFCLKFIARRNMSIHVKTTNCKKKRVCIKSEKNAKESNIKSERKPILSNAEQGQDSKIPTIKKIDHNNNCVCKKCLKSRIDSHPEKAAVPKENNTETIDEIGHETEIVERSFLCLKCNFKTNLEGNMIEHYEEVH